MWTEEKLNEMLTTPSQSLINDMRNIEGDIMVLGAAGKMGPTLCVLAKKAVQAAGVEKRIIGVSRGTDQTATEFMQKNGVEMIQGDLLDKNTLYSLPETENIIYMAGKKFGTDGNEWSTWAMNATLPAFVADKFKSSRIVAFSTGNVYPITPLADGGCDETFAPVPNGEYAMSCLARERAFEYASRAYGTKVFIYRLNFAIDLRYGVLFDLADKIMKGEKITLAMPCFNCIWQGSANEMAIRGLLHADSPAVVMNVTGPETISVKKAAMELGRYLGAEPQFDEESGSDAYLNDSSLAMETFGYPAVSAKTLIRWQAQWLLDGGRTLNKPTHFEGRNGKY